MIYLLFQHKETVKITFVQPILNNPILFIFRLRMELGLLRANLAWACQQLVSVKLQKAVQTFRPVLHAHGNLALRLQFRIVQIKPANKKSSPK